MTEIQQASAEGRLDQLLTRLLSAAERSLASGELELARATAEEVRAVDPGNRQATEILTRVAHQQRVPTGERALMTLVFSDLVGSTALSERVEPEQIRDIFARYRAEARAAVERYGGYVIHYLGDGILAGFGYPLAHEDDARRAVLAGLELVAGMNAARPELADKAGMDLSVRVGIHTGRVVVTDLGEDRSVKERDSIVGVAPNLAARVQQAALPDTVVISDVTRELVELDFHLQSLGSLELKGISRPVEVFTVEGPKHAVARLESERYRPGGMVGRDEPLAQLMDAWQGLAAAPVGTPPSGRLFLVAGETGIGKSRLVAAISDRVSDLGGYVMSGGCLPYYANLSLWPVAQMIGRSIGVSKDDREAALNRLVANLAERGLDPRIAVPFLAPLVGIDEPEGYPAPLLEPTTFLDETYNKILEWIERGSRGAPLVLIMEDLHWADPSTLALLGRVAQRPLARVLTIATTRDISAVPWSEKAEVIELGRLDQRSSGALVDGVATGVNLDDQVKASIILRADGVPLFLEELTRSVLASPSSDLVPLRLQEILAGRLKAPGLDLRVAQVAATVGPTFDSAIVASVIGDEAYTTQQLSRLFEAGLIDVSDPASATYRFRHTLLRDAAYETQVLDVRHQTHARVAGVLTEQDGAAALIAEHLALAGEPERAVGQYLLAAQEAQARGAHVEATRLLSSALDLIARFPESDERDLTELMGRMLRGLSVSSTQGYAAPEVQSDHRRAEVLAASLGTRPEVLPSLIAIWAYWLVSGELGTASGLIERLSGMVENPAYAWFAPEVESCAGWQALFQGELDEARSHLEAAIAGFRSRSPEERVSPFWPLPNDPLVVSEIALACVAAVTGHAAESNSWEDAALHEASGIGFPRGPFSHAFVLTYAAWIRRFQGDHDAARVLGAEVVGIGREYGYMYWVMLGSSYVASADPRDKADPVFLEETIATLRLMGQQAFMPSHLAYLAELYASAGDDDRALERIEEGLQVVNKTGEALHLPELLRQRGTHLIARGAIDEGREDLEAAERVALGQGANVSRLRAAISLAGLPEEFRPRDWRRTLEDAWRASPLSPEASSAGTLLAF